MRGEERQTIMLGESGLTPALNDIQSVGAKGSDVDVVFTTFSGDDRNLRSYAGSPLVINFFARSCPPCLVEMVYLQQAAEAFAGTVAIVGISVDPLREDADALIAATGVSYDLGWDPQSELFKYFDAIVMPTTVFVSSDGKVQEVRSGVLTAEALFDKIEALR